MDCSPPGSSVHGIFQARMLEWVAISSSRGSSPATEGTHVSSILRQILHHWATWETCAPLHEKGKMTQGWSSEAAEWCLGPQGVIPGPRAGSYEPQRIIPGPWKLMDFAWLISELVGTSKSIFPFVSLILNGNVFNHFVMPAPLCMLGTDTLFSSSRSTDGEFYPSMFVP